MYHKKEGVCSIDFGDGFAVPLPDHPNKTKDSRRPILTNDVADHVLTKIEPDVSCGVKYVHMAQGWSEGRLVVTALWFHVSTVQQCSHVDVENVVARIRAKAVHVYKEQDIHVGGVSTQTANGVYLESGVGVMAGKGRGTISLGSNSYCTPFCRRAVSEDEALLSELMYAVSTVVRAVAPDLVSHSHASQLHLGLQYPRQRLCGEPFLHSHQTVVRASGGVNDPQGSDLHLDTMDGTGGWTIYAGEEETSNAFDELAVFEGKRGGRGFRIRVSGLGKDWMCAVQFETSKCVHGSVWPSIGAPSSEANLGSGMRIVSYTLNQIENLESAAANASTNELNSVIAQLDSNMQSRMCGRVG